MADGQEENTLLPEQNEDGTFDFSLNKRRMSYVVRFLIIDQQKIEQFLAPWLCRKKPGAKSIYIETVLEKLPPLSKAVTLHDTIFNDLIEKQIINSLSYQCEPSEGQGS